MVFRAASRLWSSLYFRIFLSLWVVTALTLTAGYLLNWFLIADFARSNTQESRALMLRAAATLDARGEDGLVQWLSELPDTRWGSPVLVFDERGRELLDRAIPPTLAFALAHADADVGQDAPLHIVPSQPMPVLVARDGRRYSIYIRALYQPAVPPFRTQPLRNRLYVYGLAVFLTLIASFLLARSIVRPVRLIGRAVRQFASGQLQVRSPSHLLVRTDEMGVLANDLNHMATSVQAMIQARERLLRDVSHELRSPLARMRVAIGLARQANSEHPAAIERLEIEVLRLDRLIGQVLNLARMDAISGALGLERIDLVEIVDAIVRDAVFEGQARRVAVEWQQSQASVFLAGRQQWISSAVENVVRNALHHSDPGSGITIRLEATLDSVTIEVADRGPGVAPGELTRIFEPFYRAQASRGREREGDGIGLAIVARVMQVHGGTARAENRTGGGLKICLTFPITTGGRPPSVSASRI